MPDQLYTIEDLLDELDDTYFEGEPIITGPEAESDVKRKLRELYELSNIASSEAAVKAVIEYVGSEMTAITLDGLNEYAANFVCFYGEWDEVANEYLTDHFPGLAAFYKHMDLPAIGKELGNDLGGYFEVSDGRIACFNKKEGE